MKDVKKKKINGWMAFAFLALIPVTLAQYYSYLSASYFSVDSEITIGSGNWVSGGPGYGSLLVGYSNGAYAGSSAAIGESLTINDVNSLLVGKWNDTAPARRALFTVANGSGVYNDPPPIKYKNLFEVHEDGSVIVTERQGDIPMGIYGTN